MQITRVALPFQYLNKVELEYLEMTVFVELEDKRRTKGLALQQALSQTGVTRPHHLPNPDISLPVQRLLLENKKGVKSQL